VLVVIGRRRRGKRGLREKVWGWPVLLLAVWVVVGVGGIHRIAVHEGKRGVVYDSESKNSQAEYWDPQSPKSSEWKKRKRGCVIPDPSPAFIFLSSHALSVVIPNPHPHPHVIIVFCGNPSQQNTRYPSEACL
jgi:hypothetical protein